MTFEQLYQTYFADVFRFSMWLTRNRVEAEDLAAETFVRAWARRERLHTETLKAYLFAIARNQFLDGRQKTKNHEELSRELPDQAPDPQQRTAARINLDRVTLAMTKLAEPDRLAVVLRSEQSLSYAEIARILEISEGAARANPRSQPCRDCINEGKRCQMGDLWEKGRPWV